MAGDVSGDADDLRPTAPVAVVHIDVNVETLDPRSFRRVFLGTQQRWDDGDRVVLVLPPPGSTEMEWLCAELRVSERLYRRGLMEKALRGDIQKPLQARDTAHALALAASTIGAIAPLSPEQSGPASSAEHVGLVHIGGGR